MPLTTITPYELSPTLPARLNLRSLCNDAPNAKANYFFQIE
jgi:hypothetical protein